MEKELQIEVAAAVLVASLFLGYLPWFAFIYEPVAFIGFVAIVSTIAWKVARNLRLRGVARKPLIPLKTSSYAVFITGCDYGFGHELALGLAKEGLLVFAGCLNPSQNGAQQLTKTYPKLIKVIKLNVTKDDEIKAAKEYVENNLGTRKLWAVVNNAGIAKFSPIEWGRMLPLDEVWRDQMEVNYFGSIKISRVFLPLLRRTPGSRIVFMASICGRYSFRPTVAYSCTKFAVRGFADGLRREVKPFGINVSIIEPCGYKTNLLREGAIEEMKRKCEEADKSVQAAYGKDLMDYYVDYLSKGCQNASPHISEVVETMRHAVLTVEEPLAYYRPGAWRQRLGMFLIENLPETIIDHVEPYFNRI